LIECLKIKYKEKATFIIQSVVHYLTKQQSTQTGCCPIAACFPLEPLEKYMTFKDIFPGLTRTLSFNFQDFPGPKCFSRTFPVLEFSIKNPGLSRRCGNPEESTQ